MSLGHKLPCSWAGCGKAYATAPLLIAHYRSHMNGKPKERDWKNAVPFSRSDELATHKRSHRASDGRRGGEFIPTAAPLPPTPSASATILPPPQKLAAEVQKSRTSVAATAWSDACEAVVQSTFEEAVTAHAANAENGDAGGVFPGIVPPPTAKLIPPTYESHTCTAAELKALGQTAKRRPCSTYVGKPAAAQGTASVAQPTRSLNAASAEDITDYAKLTSVCSFEIVLARAQGGPYTSWNNLRNRVKGLGPSKLDALRKARFTIETIDSNLLPGFQQMAKQKKLQGDDGDGSVSPAEFLRGVQRIQLVHTTTGRVCTFASKTKVALHLGVSNGHGLGKRLDRHAADGSAFKEWHVRYTNGKGTPPPMASVDGHLLSGFQKMAKQKKRQGDDGDDGDGSVSPTEFLPGEQSIQLVHTTTGKVCTFVSKRKVAKHLGASSNGGSFGKRLDSHAADGSAFNGWKVFYIKGAEDVACVCGKSFGNYLSLNGHKVSCEIHKEHSAADTAQKFRLSHFNRQNQIRSVAVRQSGSRGTVVDSSPNLDSRSRSSSIPIAEGADVLNIEASMTGYHCDCGRLFAKKVGLDGHEVNCKRKRHAVNSSGCHGHAPANKAMMSNSGAARSVTLTNVRDQTSKHFCTRMEAMVFLQTSATTFYKRLKDGKQLDGWIITNSTVENPAANAVLVAIKAAALSATQRKGAGPASRSNSVPATLRLAIHRARQPESPAINSVASDSDEVDFVDGITFDSAVVSIPNNINSDGNAESHLHMHTGDSGGDSNRSSDAEYECEYDCGYEHQDVTMVEIHEATCTRNQASVGEHQRSEHAQKRGPNYWTRQAITLTRVQPPSDTSAQEQRQFPSRVQACQFLEVSTFILNKHLQPWNSLTTLKGWYVEFAHNKDTKMKAKAAGITYSSGVGGGGMRAAARPQSDRIPSKEDDRDLAAGSASCSNSTTLAHAPASLDVTPPVRSPLASLQRVLKLQVDEDEDNDDAELFQEVQSFDPNNGLVGLSGGRSAIGDGRACDIFTDSTVARGADNDDGVNDEEGGGVIDRPRTTANVGPGGAHACGGGSRRIVLKPSSEDLDAEEKIFKNATAACAFLKSGKSQFYSAMRSRKAYKGWYIINDGKERQSNVAAIVTSNTPSAPTTAVNANTDTCSTSGRFDGHRYVGRSVLRTVTQNNCDVLRHCQITKYSQSGGSNRNECEHWEVCHDVCEGQENPTKEVLGREEMLASLVDGESYVGRKIRKRFSIRNERTGNYWWAGKITGFDPCSGVGEDHLIGDLWNVTYEDNDQEQVDFAGLMVKGYLVPLDVSARRVLIRSGGGGEKKRGRDDGEVEATYDDDRDQDSPREEDGGGSAARGIPGESKPMETKPPALAELEATPTGGGVAPPTYASSADHGGNTGKRAKAYRQKKPQGNGGDDGDGSISSAGFVPGMSIQLVHTTTGKVYTFASKTKAAKHLRASSNGGGFGKRLDSHAAEGSAYKEWNVFYIKGKVTPPPVPAETVSAKKVPTEKKKAAKKKPASVSMSMSDAVEDGNISAGVGAGAGAGVVADAGAGAGVDRSSSESVYMYKQKKWKGTGTRIYAKKLDTVPLQTCTPRSERPKRPWYVRENGEWYRIKVKNLKRIAPEYTFVALATKSCNKLTQATPPFNNSMFPTVLANSALDDQREFESFSAAATFLKVGRSVLRPYANSMQAYNGWMVTCDCMPEAQQMQEPKPPCSREKAHSVNSISTEIVHITAKTRMKFHSLSETALFLQIGRSILMPYVNSGHAYNGWMVTCASMPVQTNRPKPSHHHVNERGDVIQSNSICTRMVHTTTNEEKWFESHSAAASFLKIGRSVLKPYVNSTNACQGWMVLCDGSPAVKSKDRKRKMPGNGF